MLQSSNSARFSRHTTLKGRAGLHSQTLQSTPSNSSSDLLIFIVTHHMETSQPISQFDVSSLLLYFLMYTHMLWNIFQGLEINPRIGREPDLSCFPQCNFLQQLVQSYTKNTGQCPYGSIEFNFSVLKTTAFQLHKMCKQCFKQGIRILLGKHKQHNRLHSTPRSARVPYRRLQLRGAVALLLSFKVKMHFL